MATSLVPFTPPAAQSEGSRALATARKPGDIAGLEGVASASYERVALAKRDSRKMLYFEMPKQMTK